MMKAKILYVDDEESNLRTFKNVLRREYDILTSKSGKEALEILDKSEVDLIIADQKMPEMTGVEFLKKAFEKKPMPYRILLTGYMDFDALKEAINEGKIFQYIQKPWEKNILVHVIEKAITAYRLQKDNKTLKERLINNNEEINRINKQLRKEVDIKNSMLKKYKQSQAELKKNEIRLEEAEIMANIGNWEFDLRTKQMFWSEGVFNIFELNQKKIKPSPKIFSEIIYKDDQIKDKKAYEEHLKCRKPSEVELRIQLKNDNMKYINKKYQTIYSKEGMPLKSSGTIQDVTEKKLFEYELRIYQEELENIIKERTAELKKERDKAQSYLDVANVIFIIIDKNQKINLINKKGIEVLEYNTEKEVLGLNWFDNFIPGQDREERRQKFIDNIKNKTPLPPLNESTLLTASGGKKFISWKNSILKDKNGKTVGILSSGDDITIRKKNELLIEDYTKELEMFNSSMLGREMRIIELKEEINKLARETRKKIPYPEIWEE